MPGASDIEFDPPRQRTLHRPDWVKETQADTWNKFAKNHVKNPEAVFIQRLAEELDRDRPTIKTAFCREFDALGEQPGLGSTSIWLQRRRRTRTLRRVADRAYGGRVGTPGVTP